MYDYIRLLRVKHYIKNFLIYIPMFFGLAILDDDRLVNATLGFLCFCFISSVVYIFNDLRDIEYDKKHPTKKNRPLASGKVTKSSALIAMLVCLVLSLVCSYMIGSLFAFAFILVYICFNIAYSMGLKNVPIVDILLLASGFIIRIMYGGIVTDISISKWLYLVVTVGSIFMGLGKRRNELRVNSESRDVLKYYNEAFLDKNMYVCIALADAFYALWAMELDNEYVIYTVPLFVVIIMCYSLKVEGKSDGDPVEVIYRDKILIGLLLLYGILIFALLYIF